MNKRTLYFVTLTIYGRDEAGKRLQYVLRRHNQYEDKEEAVKAYRAMTKQDLSEEMKHYGATAEKKPSSLDIYIDLYSNDGLSLFSLMKRTYRDWSVDL